MIRLRGVAAGYGERVVLDALSVSLARGRTTVIVGPGGSGKSTLLRALHGRHGHDAFWVRGEIRGVPSDCVYLPQRKLQDGSGTLGGRLAEQDVSEPEQALRDLWWCAPEAAEQLVPTLDRRLDSLPVGLRQLAEVTLAVRSPVSLLLLDEPDAGLLPEQRLWVSGLLHQQRGHRTIVLITHHLPLARAAGDDVMLLIDGCVIEAAEAGKFFSRPDLLRTRQFIQMGC